MRQFNELDFLFHLALAKPTKNDLFVILLTALSKAFQDSWSHMCHRSEVRQHGIEMHERIFKAIRAKDPRPARRATRENLNRFLEDASQFSNLSSSRPATMAGPDPDTLRPHGEDGGSCEPDV